MAINGGGGEGELEESLKGGGWKNCISSVMSCGNLFHLLHT